MSTSIGPISYDASDRENPAYTRVRDSNRVRVTLGFHDIGLDGCRFETLAHDSGMKQFFPSGGARDRGLQISPCGVISFMKRRNRDTYVRRLWLFAASSA